MKIKGFTSFLFIFIFGILGTSSIEVVCKNKIGWILNGYFKLLDTSIVNGVGDFGFYRFFDAGEKIYFCLQFVRIC